MSEAPAPEPGFADLVAATNYSFLRGASHPAEMVAEAINLGMTAHRHRRPQQRGGGGAGVGVPERAAGQAA